MSRPPLDGIRVADFCWAWAGPYGALQLAHLGADVIRIESEKRLCPSRLIDSALAGQRTRGESGWVL